MAGQLTPAEVAAVHRGAGSPVMLGDLHTIGPPGGVLHSWESISRGVGEDLLCNGTIRGSAGPDYRILGMRKLASSVQPIRP
jgi:hypothetical protein